jgi:hypothetical protein
MPGFQSLDYAHATLLQGTSAINFNKGVVGAGGAARDTELLGVYIDLHAGAGATLTVGGINDSNGVAASWVINGQITADTPVILPWPLLNEFGPLVLTPSVAGVILVWTRAYVGA